MTTVNPGDEACSGCGVKYIKNYIPTARGMGMVLTVDWHEDCAPSESEWLHFQDMFRINSLEFAHNYKWPNKEVELKEMKEANEILTRECEELHKMLNKKRKIDTEARDNFITVKPGDVIAAQGVLGPICACGQTGCHKNELCK